MTQNIKISFNLHIKPQKLDSKVSSTSLIAKPKPLKYKWANNSSIQFATI